MLDTKELVELLLGGLFIIVHSYDRYNRPPTNRNSTTAFRYHLSAFIYTSVYLIFYFLLTKYPSFLNIVQLQDVGGTKDILETLKELPPALVVALLLTIFIEKIVFVKNIDSRLRVFLQYSAAIPFEARRLASQLRSAPFRFEKNHIMDEVATKLADEGINEQDIVFSDTHKEKFLLAKITTIILKLESWERDRRNIRYIEENRNAYNAIFNRYGRLVKRAKICFELNDEEFEELDNPKATVAAKECKKAFQEQCLSLFASQCDFISQAVLSCNVTESARSKSLADIGFRFETSKCCAGLDVNQITTLMVLLLVIASVALMLGRQMIDDPAKSVWYSLMVGIIFTVSTACVTYTKGKWKIANRDANGGRPTGYYLLVGLTAVIVTIPVTIVFKAIYELNSAGSTDTMNIVYGAISNVFDKSLPWKIVVFVSAFSLSFLIDNKPWEKLREYQWQLLEGSINAVMIAGTTVFVLWIKNDEFSIWTLAVLRNALIGFFIGYLVPNWYRSAAYRHKVSIEDTASFIEEGGVRLAAENQYN